MNLLQVIGLSALCGVIFWPLGYIPQVAEQNALAVRANAMAQCRGEVETRVAQRTCEQREQ